MKRVVALVGVSGSGKTTLLDGLKKRLSDECRVIDEVTKGEILKYCDLDFFSKFGVREQTKFDIGRVEHQMLYEQQEITSSKEQIIIIDKPVPCALLYVLSMSSRYITDSNIDRLVAEVEDHCSNMYDLIVYLPFAKFDTKRDGLSRNVTNQFVLEVQDVALQRILTWTSTPVTMLPPIGVQARIQSVLDKLSVIDVVKAS